MEERTPVCKKTAIVWGLRTRRYRPSCTN